MSFRKFALLLSAVFALASPATAFNRDPKPFYIKVGSLCAENPQRTLADGEKEFVSRGNVFGSTSQKCPGKAEEWTPDYWAVPPGTHFAARVNADGSPDMSTLWLRQCGQPFRANRVLNHGDPVLDPWIDPSSLAGLPDRVMKVEGDVGELKSEGGHKNQPSIAPAKGGDESWRNRPAPNAANEDRDRKLGAGLVDRRSFCARHKLGCSLAAIVVGGGVYGILRGGGGNGGGARVYRPGQP